jgi:ATP-dependent DNA helicase RecQ
MQLPFLPDVQPAPSLAEAERVLRQRFGFSDWRPGQRILVEAVLAGRDALAVMPTGAGKSLCFQLPALLLPGVTLVVSPLIALMKDQVDGLLQKGVPATFVNSSIPYAEQEERLLAVRAGRVHLLYVAPERFRSRAFLRALEDVPICLFAIDEAHCISQWGHDFRPDYLRLRRAIEILSPERVLALTATANAAVQADILEQIPRPGLQKFVGGFDRPNLHFAAERLAKKADKPRLLVELVQRLRTGIIYTATRKAAEELISLLSAQGIKSVCYHAGLEPEERRQIQDLFMSGAVPVVCATNAFGMGIDKPDIRFVIHYQMPGTVEAYYQEAGRAGRDGHPSECHLLYSAADLIVQKFFIEAENPPRAAVEAVYDVLVAEARRHPEALVELTNEEVAKRVPELDGPMAVSTCVKILETAGHLMRLQRNTNRASFVLEQPHAHVPERAPVKRKVFQLLKDWCGPAGTLEVPLEMLALRAGLEEDAVRRAIHALEADRILHYEPPFAGRGVRLAEPVEPEQLAVDWQALAQKAALARRKLELMKDYVFSDGCRRGYLLRYFGDPDSPQSCGNCDVCQSGGGRRRSRAGGAAARTAADAAGEDKQLVLKVLSCAARLQGLHARDVLVDVLRGRASRQVLEHELVRLSTWALLADLAEERLAAWIDLLLERGALEEPGGRVRLTERGWRLIRERDNPDLIYPRLPPPERKRRQRRSGKAEAAGQRTRAKAGESLLEDLKRWRRWAAARMGGHKTRLPTDAQLQELCRLRPRSPLELLQAPGFGDRTVERFGRELIEILNRHAR